MLSRGATAGIGPRKFDMVALQGDNYIIAVGQRASGKAVTAEKVVFRSQAVQVYDISDLHYLFLSQGGQSLSNASLATLFSANH
jgi:hypothetical protein